ncbi:winged helix-turn-helix domain-containing tetratricopeptide repeat protein [Silicimonas algicola]|uniref:TolB-like protein n=1 Tax=Silicimonas algicola TaxID=1826607 RepID=A0A316GH99_9RHOB|nr:winged helix-turn-helix domain-containing protein [Silicimonas algicola]PWK58770.1 TolB-like protein [Silicimonas algicola]
MSRNEPEIWTKSPERVWLGAHWFDLDTGELREADGTLTDLRRQSVEVLAYLVQRSGDIVGKEDLVSAIWSDVAVTDDSLVQCIGDIRRALGPEGRDCVQTVRRRGYRLVPTLPATMSGDAQRRKRRWPLKAAIVFGTLVGLVAIIGYALTVFRAGPDHAPILPVIAVLPFSNIDDDPAQQYFVDGLTEDITTDLSRVSGLSMISSASTFALRDVMGTPVEIAHQLGADYALTGSTRRDKRRVRVTATLVEVATGQSIWADRYDRDIGGIFDLQDDVSRAVVSSLAIRLTNDEQARFERREVVNSDAYDLLLRGLRPLRTFTDSGILEARDYFRRAIDVDPRYARAHANLALTYATSILFRLGENTDRQDLALSEAELAVALDPRLPQAQFALAVVLLSRHRHDAAISAAREAIRLEPSSADGYAVLAQTLAYGGDKEEALAAIRTAKRLSPRYTFAYLWVEGHILFQLRRYDEARAILEDVVARNPEMLLGKLTLAATYGHLGLADEADWLAMEILTLSPDLSAFDEGNALPFRSNEDRANYVEGLLLAGITE